MTLASQPRPRRAHARLALAGLGAVALLVAPGLLGSPVLSYAASGSMVPTLQVGDGFVVDPAPGALQVGDIIVFASVVRGGQLAVHRIVGGDAEGWTTKGDANAATDQQAGEPLVTPERIHGRVFTFADRPLVLPGIGVPFIEGAAAMRQAERAGSMLQLVAYAMAAASLLLVLIPTRAAPPLRAPRSPWAARIAASLGRRLPRGWLARHAALGAIAAIGLLALASVPSMHEEVVMSLVVTDSPPPGQARSTTPGGALARDLDAQALAFAPTLVVVDGTPRIRAAQDHIALAPGARGALPVEEVAGAEAGLQEDRIQVWRYPAVLPDEATLALHRVMPGAPLLAPLGLMLAGFTLWFRALDTGALPARALLPRRTGGSP
jgi:signal peptidase I